MCIIVRGRGESGGIGSERSDMTQDFEEAVRAAEQQRCAAMLAGDLAALDAVLDPALQFHHATGTVDDKPGYLAKMASGRIQYTSIDWSEERITTLGPDTAMLTGRMATAVRVEGDAKRLDNRVLTVWEREGGQWRMLAFQSTPIAG